VDREIRTPGSAVEEGSSMQVSLLYELPSLTACPRKPYSQPLRSYQKAVSIKMKAGKVRCTEWRLYMSPHLLERYKSGKKVDSRYCKVLRSKYSLLYRK
jgi:hypothetical protein